MACCPTDVTDCIARGTTWTALYTFTQSDGVSVLDLTGYTFRFVVRTTSGTAVHTYANADMSIDLVAGTVVVTIDTTDSNALSAGITHYGGLQVTRPDSTVWAHPDRIVFEPYTPEGHS